MGSEILNYTCSSACGSTSDPEDAVSSLLRSISKLHSQCAESLYCSEAVKLKS